MTIYGQVGLDPSKSMIEELRFSISSETRPLGNQINGVGSGEIKEIRDFQTKHPRKGQEDETLRPHSEDIQEEENCVTATEAPEAPETPETPETPEATETPDSKQRVDLREAYQESDLPKSVLRSLRHNLPRIPDILNS